MLDINFIRENTEKVKQGMIDKGEQGTEAVDEVLKADEQWRSLVQQVDELRSESNTKAREIGKLMGEGKKEEAQEIIKHTSKLKEKIKSLEDDLQNFKSRRDDL